MLSKEKSKQWRDDPKNSNAILGHRMKIHGITADQYNKMLADQNGCCQICKRKPKTKRLHVDHNHETGQIRGLLCMHCNTKLGIIEHPKPEYLEYLKKYKL